MSYFPPAAFYKERVVFQVFTGKVTGQEYRWCQDLTITVDFRIVDRSSTSATQLGTPFDCRIGIQ